MLFIVITEFVLKCLKLIYFNEVHPKNILSILVTFEELNFERSISITFVTPENILEQSVN